MATVRDICRRALLRGGIIDSLHDPSAEEARDALDALNEMMHGWKAEGVDLFHTDFVLSDAFLFWVPPADLPAETIDVAAYQGTWDADTNTPTLAGSSGTNGYVYRVSVAGSTTLDDVTSWNVDDFAVLNGRRDSNKFWLKGQSSRQFDAGCIAMLAARLCDEYGMQVPPRVARDATMAWYRMQPFYVKPSDSRFDAAMVDTPSRRHWDVV